MTYFSGSLYERVFDNREENMELFVISPNLRFTNPTVAPGSTVRDLIEHLTVKEVSRTEITLVNLNSGVCCTLSAGGSVQFDDHCYG